MECEASSGNNEGWFQVGLVKKETVDSLAGDHINSESNMSGILSASESDLEDVSFSMDNFDACEGDTTLVRGKVANWGDRPMVLVHVDFFEWADDEWKLFDEETIPLLMPGQTRTLGVPFNPTSSTSDVKMVIDPRLGEADFENNSIEITRDFGDSGGCSVAPFPAMALALPLLLLLKR